MNLARNIEIKARLTSLDDTRQVAQRLATSSKATLHQVDTYFHCSSGRLKLREINGREAFLIWYRRPDQPAAKDSHYRLVPVNDPTGLCFALSSALGQRVVVAKRRELYWYHQVRIHLDHVERLGDFLEFEAVLGPEQNEALGRKRVEFLLEQFHIDSADLLAGSYCDLLDQPA